MLETDKETILEAFTGTEDQPEAPPKLEPARSMKELLGRIYEAGASWRLANMETKVNKKTKEVSEVIPLPSVYAIAEELSRLVNFAFITKQDTADKSLLFYYDPSEGIYKSSGDQFNTFCRIFDRRVDPKRWISVCTMVRTLTKIKRPLEDPNLIPAKNGIINLKTRELLPFSPNYAITSKIATNYKPPKSIPRGRDGTSLEDWLEAIACGDKEIITLYWQIILEAINPNYTRGKFAVLYGEGNNGKGTFQRLLINLIGESNIAALKPAQFSERHSLESLIGKVCNIGDDAPNEYLKDTSNLMSITTGDTVQVNPKGTKMLEMTFKTFILFSGNYVPTGGNKSKGWYRRLMIVPFNADFNGEKEKPWIKNEFLADSRVLEYVLYKAVNQEPFTQFIEPQAVKDILEEYKEKNDYVLAYVNQNYIPNNWHELPAVPVYMVIRDLKSFAIDAGIDKPNTYGAGEKVAKHLNELTEHNYTIKVARVKATDLTAGGVDLYDYDPKKLTKAHKSIVKKM